MGHETVSVDIPLVRALVATQFPQWAHLPIECVQPSGLDHHCFHLGDAMLIKLPRDIAYAPQVKKMHQWLPILQAWLPIAIPVPLAKGAAQGDYPFSWSIYQWLPGETVAATQSMSQAVLARQLAEFLVALRGISCVDGPLPGPDNFYRGGALAVYDAEVHAALQALADTLDVETAAAVWAAGLATVWQGAPVWVHGDVSGDNLLVQGDQLTAVIDFGLLAKGDPACDLVMAWTWFDHASRLIFKAHLGLDRDTWRRGRAWALWKALITVHKGAARGAMAVRSALAVIDQVLMSYRADAGLGGDG